MRLLRTMIGAPIGALGLAFSVAGLALMSLGLSIFDPDLPSGH